jgi:hypothetical protein
MDSTHTHAEDPDKKTEAVELKPTEAEIDEEVRKFIAGKPSKITVKDHKPRLKLEPLDIPPGYEYGEAPERIRRPMTPEFQQILDDAKAAGFEVRCDFDLDGVIFIVKDRGAGKLPTGLQIMPDHAAFRVDEPSNMEEIHDYSVMRSVLGL